MKKNYTITIKGKEKTWSINTSAKPEWVKDWCEDGLEIHEILYTVPEFVVYLGLLKPWIWCSDLFNFKNPWRK